MVNRMLGKLGKCAVLIALCCMCGQLAGADAAKPDANALLDEQRLILDDILGIEPSSNVCLIDPHQMITAYDLPGRLVVLSGSPDVTSETLRYSFRLQGTKVKTQTEQMQPVRYTKVEGTKVKNTSILTWIGRKVEATDIAEIKTTPMPAASISVDDLDEEQIRSKLGGLTPEGRRRVGIILSVIPYEAYASVCRQVNSTADTGVWYIKVGKTWYAKNSDELRRYYMVAVYTPVAFYDDLGLFEDTKSMSYLPEASNWQPLDAGTRRSTQFRAWTHQRSKTSVLTSTRTTLSEQKIAL